MNQNHNHLYLGFVPRNRKTSWVPPGVGCIYPHGGFSLGSPYQHSGYHNLDFGYRVITLVPLVTLVVLVTLVITLVTAVITLVTGITLVVLVTLVVTLVTAVITLVALVGVVLVTRPMVIH